MAMIFKKVSLIWILALISIGAWAQSISVQNVVGMKPDTLISRYLASEGVKLLHGKWNWNAGNITGQQIGFFNYTGTGFPFSSGIIMATGNINVAPGPNSSGSSSSTTGVSSATIDSELATLIPGYNLTTTNALEFDFYATTDTFAFTYIFGSEEYPEYAGTSYNDVFAFFLHGVDPWTGYIATKNVAVIPNTVTDQNPNGIPVSINNLNHYSYQQYYITNNSGAVQYDGYTTDLTATSYLASCNEYHMKLSIANVGDQAYDSGVFLKKGSFYLPTVEISEYTDMEGNDTIIKNCNSKYIDLSYSLPARQQLNLSAQILNTSTAEWGTDFVINQINPDGTITPLTSDNNEFSFNYGDTLIRLNLTALPDAVFAPGEVKTINLVITQFLCDNFMFLDGTSQALVQRDTFTYYLVDNNQLILNDTTIFYCGECTHITANLISGTEPLIYQWTPTTGIADPNAKESDCTIENSTQLTVTATDRWGCLSDTALYNIEITHIPTIDGHYIISPKSGCIPMEVLFSSQVSPEQSQHTWIITDENGVDTIFTDRNFTYIFEEPGEYSVALYTSSATGCNDSIRLHNIISVSDYPVANFSYDPADPQNGRPIYFHDLSTGDDIVSYEWGFGDGGTSNTAEAEHSYHVNSNEAFNVIHTVTNKNGCSSTAMQTIAIEDKFVLYVPSSFTPNDDDLNDIFIPTTRDIAQYQLYIYDRYGSLVFYTEDTAQGWDGTTDGKTCKPGIYTYLIKYIRFSNLQEELIARGSITLVR